MSRSPSQQPMSFGRALLLLAGGGVLVYVGTQYLSQHSLWMVPVGVLLGLYALGRISSR